MKIPAATALVLLAAAGTAAAQGIVIPEDPKIPPLALERHHVRVTIQHPVATTEVEQVFVNHTDRPLEAQYVFPIPRGAAINRFTMLVNGQEKAGDLLERDEARRIYQQIVWRAQDPGLLEYLGGNLFRMSLFPIPARERQRITLRFEQILPSHDGLTTYVYPILSGPREGTPSTGSFSVEAEVRSAEPILALYSPTHPVEIARRGDREARVSFADRTGSRARDFQLYYAVSSKDLSLHLVTHRPDPREPGYFLLLVSPRAQPDASRIIERDFVFVMDTSGSMAGAKFTQALNALKHGLRTLRDKDRFAIVRFSTDVEVWRKEFAPVRECREAALSWVDALAVGGGTNIAGALEAALAFPRDPARPFYLVFLTDGKPTVGSTRDPKEILGKLERARSEPGGESLRVFTWGVGYDVDTHLLDGLAEIGRGFSEYVRPEEDLELKLTAFFSRTSWPVLSGLKLYPIGEAIQFAEVYPRTFPDLYAGSTLVVLGRYAGQGHAALRLSGFVNEQEIHVDTEADFPAEERSREVLARLWAMRRIGHLLDSIRRYGESPELVQDVVRLSREYGIPTPYTSALILEGSKPQPPPPRPAGGTLDLQSRAKALVDGLAGEAGPRVPPAAERRETHSTAPSADGLKAQSGRAAVEAAEYLLALKQARAAAGTEEARIRRAAGTRFYFYRGFWVDERVEGTLAVTRIRFGGEAFFRLLEKRPELAEALRLGTSVITVTAPGKALVVDSSGPETLSDEALEELFRPAEAK